MPLKMLIFMRVLATSFILDKMKIVTKINENAYQFLFEHARAGPDFISSQILKIGQKLDWFPNNLLSNPVLFKIKH